jgi:hypothetical protein
VRALALVALLAACGGKSSPPPTPPEPVAEQGPPLTAEQHAAAVEDLQTWGCACADAACVGVVDAELAEIIGELQVGVDVPIDEAAAEDMIQYLGCVAQKVPPGELGSYRALEARFAEIEAVACACKDLDCTQHIFGHLGPELVAFAGYFVHNDPAMAETFQARAEKIEACVKPFSDAVANEAIADLTTLRDAACACKDATCADQVNAEFEAFLQKHADTKGDQAQAETIGALAGEMSACLETARGTPAP